jgi:hypothetical protein
VIRDDRVRETWRVPGACDPRLDLVEEAFEATTPPTRASDPVTEVPVQGARDGEQRTSDHVV